MLDKGLGPGEASWFFFLARGQEQVGGNVTVNEGSVLFNPLAATVPAASHKIKNYT